MIRGRSSAPRPRVLQALLALCTLLVGFPSTASPLAAQERWAALDSATAAADTSEVVGPVRERWTPPPGADEWGQEKNWGLAIVETYLSNFIPWVFNEYIRADLKISQISPRSWWRNISQGMGWDDNHFSVNHLAHPLQGHMYYNAARSNGFSYWGGLAFAAAGSYHWECCGESHLASVNDWVNTSIGGAAFGEAMYRTSSMILDNEATGSERVWREAIAFLLAPTRGFTRLTTGRASRVYDNPADNRDRIPDDIVAAVDFGVRSVEDGRYADVRGVHPFVDFEMIYGSLESLTRKKPFDFFTAGIQLNLHDKQTLGRLQFRGNLWHSDLDWGDSSRTKFIVAQDFDYINNAAYEFGGQSVSALLLNTRQIGEQTTLGVQAAFNWMLMGGVNSEYAFEAEIPGVRERLREYDFGTGPGGRITATIVRGGQRILDASYRVNYLKTLNGSNNASEFDDENTEHLIQIFTLRGRYDLSPTWGIGADINIHNRFSEFETIGFENVEQETTELRFYGTWVPPFAR